MNKIGKKIFTIVLCALLMGTSAAVCASEVIKLNQKASTAASETDVTFSQIVNGGGHTLALDADKKNVYGWGDNTFGQVGGLAASSGLNDTEVKVPRLVFSASGSQQIVKVAATQSSSALLVKTSKDDQYGTVYTWGAGGADNFYQNGTRNDIAVKTPTALTDPSLSKVKDIAAGLRHYVCITSDTKVVTWGDNRNGQVTGTADGKAYSSFDPHAVTVEIEVSDNNREVDINSNSYDLTSTSVTAGVNNTFIQASMLRDYYFILGENDNRAYSQTEPENGLSAGIDLAGVIGNGNIASASDVTFAKNCMYFVFGANLYSVGNSPKGTEKTELVTGGVKQAVATGMENGGRAAVAAFLTTDSKVKVFGTAESAAQAVWGTATRDTISAASAEEVSFQIAPGTTIKYLSGGVGAIQCIDSGGRAHIFGDAAAAPLKFPSIEGAAVDTDSAKPMLYNLATYAKYTNYDVPQGSNYFANDKFYMLVNPDPGSFDMSLYSCLDHGEAEFDLDVNKLVTTAGQTFFSENDAVTLVNEDHAEGNALNTRYGKVKAYKPYVIGAENTNEGSPDFITVDASNPSIMHVRGGAVKSEEDITVRLYLKEYANGDPDEIVNVFSFTVTFTYGDWKPIAKTAEMDENLDIDFTADANANIKDADGTKTPVVYDPAQTEKKYKKKTFRASDLVSDPDDFGSALTFNLNNARFLVGGVEQNVDNYFTFEFDETEENVSITAIAFVLGGKLILTVSDPSDGACEISLNINVEAKASDVVNIDLASLTAPNGICSLNLADLYDDSSQLKFRSGPEANVGVTVTVAEDGKSFTATSVNPGKTKIYVKAGVGAAAGAEDIILEFTIDFPVNSPPKIRAGYDKAIQLYLGSVYYTAYDLFEDVNANVIKVDGHYVIDPDAPEGDTLRLTIMSGGDKGVFQASTADNDSRLNITPKVNGTDKVFIRVSDKGGNAAVYAFTFEVQNVFDSPQIPVGMHARTIDASYLATFLYNLPLTVEQRNAAIIVAEGMTSSGGVTCVLSGDGKQLTVTPTSAGLAVIEIKLQITLDNTPQTVMMKVNMMVTSQFSLDKFITVDTNNDLTGGVYKLTVDELIQKMELKDRGGAPLVSSQYTFKSVYLRGDEKYATAEINANDNTVLHINPVGNTEEDATQFIHVILSSKVVDGEEYAVQIPFKIQNLKLYPTDSEYQMILWLSMGGAGAVIVILILISFGVNTRRRHEYEGAIEKAKARDRMKKAQALGGTKEQVLKRGMGQNVKITPSRQPMGMVPPMAGPMGMNNPYMRPSQAPLGLGSNNMSMAQPGMSMTQPNMSMPRQSVQQSSVQQGATSWQTGQSVQQYASQQPVPPAKSQNGRGKKKKNGSMLALETSDEPDNFDSLPPLKAQNNVPKNARDEIENKIQARIAQENALRQQQEVQPPAQESKKKKGKNAAEDEDDNPKMSKAERKKQEMLEKLRAKMLADREKNKK